MELLLLILEEVQHQLDQVDQETHLLYLHHKVQTQDLRMDMVIHIQHLHIEDLQVEAEVQQLHLQMHKELLQQEEQELLHIL